MKYKQFFNLLNNVYDYKFKNEVAYSDYYTLYTALLDSYTEDNDFNIVLKSFHTKNIALQGITFNNIHLITNSNLIYNFFKCLSEKEIFNKKKFIKPINLHLYYDMDNFSLEEVQRLQFFNSIINKKMLYVYNIDIVNELNNYLTENNFEIVYLIKKESELSGHKQHIQIEFNDTNIQDMRRYFELIKNMDATKKVYTTINSKNTSTINEYFSLLKDMINVHSDIEIINVSYLLGEHIGVDEYNNCYMKLNTEIFYPTEEKSFQDYYVEYNTFSEECLNCMDCIFCVTNLLEKTCPHKKLI